MENKDIAREFLKTIKTDFFSLTFYYHQKRKGVDTTKLTGEELVEAIIDEIGNGLTPQDLWDEWLDKVSHHWDQEMKDYWEDHMEDFDLEVFFPSDKRLPDGGAWIKIRTKNGYEVHYAKRAKRKFPALKDELTKSLKKMESLLHDASATSNDMQEERNGTIKKQLYRSFEFHPYEVFIYKTKTQKRYLTTNEYELFDVNEMIEAVRDKVYGVKVRNLFTAKDNDKVFYLRSRGISKQVAEIMANLENCYFKVDMVSMMKEYDSWFSNHVKVVSK